MGTETHSSEQRQAILAVIVALIACVAVSSPYLISGVSPVVGDLTLGLSFYALLAFCLHLRGLTFERTPSVRRWQALALLGVTAAAAWALVFPHAMPLLRTVAAVSPGCLIALFVAGPWRGLLPASKATRDKSLSKEEVVDE